MLLAHVFHATGHIALSAGQVLLAPGQLFQTARLFAGLLIAALCLARRFITVFILAHLHLEQLTQIFALLLPSRTATTGSALEVHIGSIDFGLRAQHELQGLLLGLQCPRQRLIFQLRRSHFHLRNGILQMRNRVSVTIVCETEPLGQPINRAARALHRIAL